MNEKEKAINYINKLLVPNRVCNCCMQNVLKSTTDGYKYQCVYCDVDLFDFETQEKKNKVTREQFEEMAEIVEGWM